MKTFENIRKHEANVINILDDPLFLWDFLVYLSPRQLESLIKIVTRSKKENKIDGAGDTFLSQAARSHFFKLMVNDVLHEDTINLKDNRPFKNTVLHDLIANEEYDNASLLIKTCQKKEFVLDYLVRDIEGKTSLILASKMRANSIVKLILDSCPEHKKKELVNMQDENGNTALHYSILLGNVEAVEILIEASADVNLKNLEEKVAFDFLSLSDEEAKKRIKEVCNSVSIDADRDENAKSNLLMDQFKNAPLTVTWGDYNYNFNFQFLDFPLAKKNKEANDFVEKYKNNNIVHPVLLGSLSCEKFLDDNDVESFFKEAQQERTEGNKNIYLIVTRKESIIMKDEEKKFISEQYESFTGKSVFERCMEDRKKLLSAWLQTQICESIDDYLSICKSFSQLYLLEIQEASVFLTLFNLAKKKMVNFFRHAQEKDFLSNLTIEGLNLLKPKLNQLKEEDKSPEVKPMYENLLNGLEEVSDIKALVLNSAVVGVRVNNNDALTNEAEIQHDTVPIP